MKIIKRNGKEEKFDENKIISALERANTSVDGDDKMSPTQIKNSVEYTVQKVKELRHTPNVEEVQDIIEDRIMLVNKTLLARNYIKYRYQKELMRKSNTTDDSILSIINMENEEIKQENSNKNPAINSVQRDYMAGEVSKDLTKRILLPKDVIEAHEEGIIHFHDSDYYTQRMHNCDLINLNDMLQNGTVISGTKIEKPHRFLTACNVATQIIAQVASSQYGGQSITLSHLAPFVETSRRKLRKLVREEMKGTGTELNDEQVEKFVEKRLREEISSGIQTIQYQILTLMTTNGQTPFVTIFMYLNEVENKRTKDDLAIIIEEMLKQRIKGVQNEDGVWVTPAFPKLIYVLEEDNITPDSKYWEVTKLAVKCSASRMVPDYISEKQMKLLKLSKGEKQGEGDCFPSMGCLDYDEMIELDTGNIKIGELAEISKNCKCVKLGNSCVYDVTDLGLNIKSGSEFTELRGVVINHDESNWLNIAYKYSCGTVKHVLATYDHPFKSNGSVVLAENLSVGSTIDGVKDKLIIADIKKLDIVADSYDVTTENEHFNINDDIYSHNCRSFLTPDKSGNGFNNVANALDYVGKPKYYGRFNQGVVTINLPDVALSSGKDFDKFWEIFDERLELCHKALRCRHERLKGTPSDVAPILWQYGALARLKKGETIDKLLVGGYSTISLGYAGLYECVKYMTGHSHTDDDAKPFALSVMQYMNDKCEKWKKEEDIDYSVYGTPLESTTYKFAKALQRRFGIIKDVTDHGYITNSYHVNVREEIDAFKKLEFESEFQRLSPGGAISYIEVPNMKGNLKALTSIVQFIYENIMYAEINTKSDYCQVCGYDGEIQIVEDDGKLVWQCPNCGNRDQDKMNVARRTCGYIGTQFWNQGRTEEIRDRVLHL